MSVSAIVLAGGRSSRFGRDKLAEPLDGVPLLTHAVDAVRSVADEVVVVLGLAALEPDLPGSIVFARDPEPFGGPLVGLVAGLEVASSERVVVVGGDMPTLAPPVLGLLLERLGEVSATALADDGVVRPLPMALDRGAALPVGRRLLAEGRRDLRSLLDGLSMRPIATADWGPLDPEARTLRDIDRPSDLEV